MFFCCFCIVLYKVMQVLNDIEFLMSERMLKELVTVHVDYNSEEGVGALGRLGAGSHILLGLF